MSLDLKPSHAAVKAYYEDLRDHGQLHFEHEGAVRRPFGDLLAKCGKKSKPQLTLITEYLIERARHSIRVDGALVDLYHLPHGYWEAKDEKDDLIKEVERKLSKGYPRDNIIFQAPERAILYQNGVRTFDESIKEPEALVSVVNAFFNYKAPHIQEWEAAVSDFSERIPELAAAVKKTIDAEKQRNPSFVRSFEDFYALCRQAINPNLSEEAVERMLVQHLLTERIFRKIFNNSDFTRRNVVAVEIEKVIAELTKRSLNRDEFLSSLERFYRAIERSAEETTTFSEKQAFLNKVYERFFQGYSPKEADTHGIVYTPQPIVNFMVRSVEEILQKEFGRSLSDKGVHILDPFVGTGNFIVRIMQEIKTSALPHKYENELHCNEVMLLPYYIASMNIEHAFYERTNEYKAFPGICLVDTFELAEPKQAELFTQENTQRVQRQKDAPIFVVIGNPPYNMGQVDESDNNKNRKYDRTDESVDNRVRSTYVADSTATLRNKLSDPYVKAIRWASDRIGKEGVVAFVTNDSFVDQVAFDGMRKHLSTDFNAIYVLDLGGNVRKNPKLSGTTHNVFGIQVGVSINLFIRTARDVSNHCEIRYARVDEFWRKEQKYAFLEDKQEYSAIEWRDIRPYGTNLWLEEGTDNQFPSFHPIATKSEKSGAELPDQRAIFTLFSLGVVTNRDAYTYSFNEQTLRKTVHTFTGIYRNALAIAKEREGDVSDLIDTNNQCIKWTRQVISALKARAETSIAEKDYRISVYRPFTKQFLLFNDFWNEEQYRIREFLPTARYEEENRIICFSAVGNPNPFQCLTVSGIPNLHLTGDSQCVAFYTYAEDGSNRRENITDWALEQFRSRYGDASIGKWDIFHYVYAVLHHPEYRERYAANLRRELPRIPFVGASGAKAQIKSDADAAINGRSSTNAGDADVAPSASSGQAINGRSASNLSAAVEGRSSTNFDAALKRRSTTNAEVRGKNSSKRPLNAQANARSFDSATGRASASGTPLKMTG